MSTVTHVGTPTTILLIGSGKLSKHLSHWFNLNQKDSSKLLTWDRHQDPHAIHRYAAQATHIWLAISDSAIIPFYEKYLIGHDAAVIHFSGALHDPRLISAHPLMSFANEIYADDFYPQIHFALTGTDSLCKALPGFTNPHFHLKPELKPLYHALCVTSGNFPQMLWNEVHKIAADQKMPAEAFDLYIQQITQNFLNLKQAAITGPIARKEAATINKNIDALAGTPLQSIYQSFTKEFLK
jgi:2-dehydropantoate 2-reductase